jgi:esterase/lipase superfamily enzyme
VVTAIGARLAQGQALTDAKPGVVETFGAIAKGTVGTVANVAVDTVTAPTRLVDPTRTEKSVDTAADSIKLAPQ